MKVLVTGCDRPFGSAVATHLRQTHEVVAIGRVGSGDVQEAELPEPEQVKPIVVGVEAVVYADAFEIGDLASVSDERTLDEAVRGAYVVLDEAQSAGVGRAVAISTLDLLDDYPDDYVLEETFRPRPSPEAVSLAPYLVEQTFREFAREGPIVSICLRFGRIDRPGGTPQDLALEAIDRALAMPLGETRYRWFLYHICGSQRFPFRGARQAPMTLRVED